MNFGVSGCDWKLQASRLQDSQTGVCQIDAGIIPIVFPGVPLHHHKYTIIYAKTRVLAIQPSITTDTRRLVEKHASEVLGF